MKTVSIAYSVAPQFDHETSICKLDCISLTTDTAECARKNEKRKTREIKSALRRCQIVVMSIAINGVDTKRQVRITDYRSKRGVVGFEGKCISTGLWYDSARVWVAL